MEKVELYAYTYDEATDTYNIKPEPIYTFESMKEFEEKSGVPALIFFMNHPLKNLGFCYCLEGQDITNKENIKFASYGFMED